ncbi:hypothetical protein AsAng_0000480 [Aureispira anguillae]|uniref:Uncharacterized protein n=1 Tax=Aureispira anguillae TaxID=2864201 RepID=A0A915VK19_9BACT|nr:hypothetical protein AsAng_0000480 [Aureispira anguillae]
MFKHSFIILKKADTLSSRQMISPNTPKNHNKLTINNIQPELQKKNVIYWYSFLSLLKIKCIFVGYL